MITQHLPCPFCGDRDIRSHYRDGEWLMECHSCSCQLTGFPSEQETWTRWNTRPPKEEAWEAEGYRYLVRNRNWHLLKLLADGKGDEKAFHACIQRCIESEAQIKARTRSS